MKKKIISVILTFTLCMGAAVPALALTTTTDDDPLDGAAMWAVYELDFALANNLILNDMINNWTQPMNRLVAAEAIAKLLEALTDKTIGEIAGENGYDLTEAFSDTINVYASFLKQAGISNGVDGDRYDPDGIFTRAQMVTMLGRMAKGFLGVDIADFPKGSNFFQDVPGWADEYVGWACDTGITEGVGGGRFDSNGTLQNQHMGAFMWRMFEYYYKSPYELLRTYEQITVEQMDKLKNEAASWQSAIAGIGDFAEFIAIEPSNGSEQQVYVAFRQYNHELEKIVYIDGFERIQIKMPDGVEARICSAEAGAGSGELIVGFRFISDDTERIEIFYTTKSFIENDNWINRTLYSQGYVQLLRELPPEERLFK